jgi:ataxia telangiectasia mutated family protein
MEQAFQLVNNLLARDDAGRRRKLRIRTYKVVPLQNKNGLIEFVANTEPLGNFLSRLYECVASA